jgi:hypothetical protein
MKTKCGSRKQRNETNTVIKHHVLVSRVTVVSYDKNPRHIPNNKHIIQADGTMAELLGRDGQN